MSENDIQTEVNELRAENADLHERIETLQGQIAYLTKPAPAGAATPTIVIDDGAISVRTVGHIQHIAFNVDGIIWRTSVHNTDIAPECREMAEDAQADAKRFIDSAHVICAADDAATHMERARSASNHARHSLHVALACLAAVMPANQLKIVRRALAEVEESLTETREAYRELLDVGARQAVDLPLAPADVPVFGVHVPVEASPSTAGTVRTSPVPDDDALLTAAAYTLTGSVEDDIMASAAAIAAQHQAWLDSQDQAAEG